MYKLIKNKCWSHLIFRLCIQRMPKPVILLLHSFTVSILFLQFFEPQYALNAIAQARCRGWSEFSYLLYEFEQFGIKLWYLHNPTYCNQPKHIVFYKLRTEWAKQITNGLTIFVKTSFVEKSDGKRGSCKNSLEFQKPNFWGPKRG